MFVGVCLDECYIRALNVVLTSTSRLWEIGNYPEMRVFA